MAVAASNAGSIEDMVKEFQVRTEKIREKSMQDSLEVGLAEGSLPQTNSSMPMQQGMPVNPAFVANHIKQQEPDEFDALDPVDDPMFDMAEAEGSTGSSVPKAKPKARGKAKGKAKGKAGRGRPKVRYCDINQTKSL